MSRAYVYYFPRPSISPCSIRSSHGSDFWEVIKTFFVQAFARRLWLYAKFRWNFPSHYTRPAWRAAVNLLPTIDRNCWKSRRCITQFTRIFRHLYCEFSPEKSINFSKPPCWCSFDRDLHIKTPQYQRNKSISSDFPYFIRSLRVRLHEKKMWEAKCVRGRPSWSTEHKKKTSTKKTWNMKMKTNNSRDNLPHIESSDVEETLIFWSFSWKWKNQLNS